jgi:hypothetical protein
MIKSRLRLVLTMVILVVSIAALAWSFLPGARIVRRQRIQPTEMQLPTPSGFVPPNIATAGLNPCFEAACSLDDAKLFLLYV